MTAAVGGGLLLLARSPILNPPVTDHELNENMAAAIATIVGINAVIAGTAFIVAGIPVTVAGHAMMNSEIPWRDVRYDYKGLGTIVEGEYVLPDMLQARAALGYHFNPHLFLGAGVAPGFRLNKPEYGRRLSLPFYADFRWSMTDRMITPYLSLSAGLDVMDVSPYLGLGLGTRIYSTRSVSGSFWGGLSGEATGSGARIGITMGYSF